MEILFSHTISNFTERKEFAPSGSKFFPLSEVTILKRGAFEVITAHYSCLPLMCVNSLSVLVTPLSPFR